MSCAMEGLVSSALALPKVSLTLTGFAEPLDTGNWSQAYVLLHRVERSLQGMEDGVLKVRINDFVELHLFLCIFNGEMHEICVTRIIVADMAYIHESFEYEYGTDE